MCKHKNFLLQNSGITVIAHDVTIDRGKKTVKLDFPPETGIVNGGHTQLAVLNAKAQRDISSYGSILC